MKQILGATTSSFVGFTFDEAVRGIAKAGLKYIELLTLYGSDAEGEIGELEPMTGEMDEYVKSVKKKLRKHSLKVEAISGTGSVLTSKGVEGLKRRIDFANRIGAKIVSTEPGNPSSEEEIKIFYKNMGEIAEYASEKDIIIAFETAHDFLPNAQKTAPVLKKINSEYVRLNYDTANVIFNPGLPYTVTVGANPTSIAIRRFTSTITAMVKDQYDNPVADGTVMTFTTNLGSLGDLGLSSDVKTTVNGVANTTLKSGSRPGTATISATVDSIVGQTQVIFIWDGGIAGVSWGAEIMPVKALPGGNYIGEGIKYAVDNGARVIILAFRLTGYNEAVEAQIADAYDKGALLVAGAGNCGGGGEDCSGINPVMYPAALPNVLAVAATSQNDDHLFFSEHHPYVDVAAPGERIPGFMGWDYNRLPGTEYAAAQAAGLAALMWSVNPTLTNHEVESIIGSTAVDQVGDPVKDTPGKDDYFGHGRIDAGAAVMAALCYPQVEPDGLYFSISNHSNPPAQMLTSAKYCMWSTGATVSWLSISPSEGYTITVSIDISNLPGYGVHTATITATSTLTNCMDYSQTIPVTYWPCWRSYLPLLLKNHGSD